MQPDWGPGVLCLDGCGEKELEGGGLSDGVIYSGQGAGTSPAWAQAVNN